MEIDPLRYPKFCKKGNCDCRHCSNEAYKEVERAPDFKLHKMVITEKVYDLGQYCNNACCWAGDLKECPIPGALEVCRDAIAHWKDTSALRSAKKKGIS